MAAKKQTEPVAAVEPVKKTATKKDAFKVPKTVGACADLLFELRAKKSEAKKKVDEIEAQEKAVKDFLIENLPKSSQTGAVGKLAKAQVVTKQEPQVEDWDALYTHISKTKSWDLLQRRLSTGAIKERWENKKQVPGVGVFPVVSVSVTKVG
jgi:LPS O-antigen subunit length determinant protein (WzzB/FepE family)